MATLVFMLAGVLCFLSGLFYALAGKPALMVVFVAIGIVWISIAILLNRRR